MREPCSVTVKVDPRLQALPIESPQSPHGMGWMWPIKALAVRQIRRPVGPTPAQLDQHPGATILNAGPTHAVWSSMAWTTGLVTC